MNGDEIKVTLILTRGTVDIIFSMIPKGSLLNRKALDACLEFFEAVRVAGGFPVRGAEEEGPKDEPPPQ